MFRSSLMRTILLASLRISIVTLVPQWCIARARRRRPDRTDTQRTVIASYGAVRGGLRNPCRPSQPVVAEAVKSWFPI
jgi:hypothetical protein